MQINPGYDPAEIAKFQEELKLSGKIFKYVDEDEVSDEMAEFHFLGKQNGKPVIFDCLLGTLQLAYESNLLEMAEMKTKEKFPDYRGFDFEIDEKGNAISSGEESEEIEAYKAYAMYEIEEAGEANVAESVELDESFDYGVGLEVYLNVLEVTETTVIKFINDFNEGKVELDPVRYSFESDDDDDD